MSREFKFRAWHKGFDRPAVKTPIKPSMLYEERVGQCLTWLQQGQPLEVMQSIGLKDKNGVEIYEGDILKFDILGSGLKYNPLSALTHIVEFQNAAWGFTPTHPKLHAEEDRGWSLFLYDDGELWNMDYFTVIGNIHANPELLEPK